MAAATTVVAAKEAGSKVVVEAEKVADKAVEVAKVCDMKCFKECLILKEFAPVDIVEKCVTVKCSCDV